MLFRSKGKTRNLAAKNIIVATGSESTSLPGIEVDEKTVVSSTGALSLTAVPKRLLVIGGGYIGLEMGMVWKRLGAEVTVVEFLDRILPGMDGEVAKTFTRLLKKQGFAIKTKTKVVGVKKNKSGLKVTIEPAAGGDRQDIACDTVLVAVGRRPFTAGLGLDQVGVALDKAERIVTDLTRKPRQFHDLVDAHMDVPWPEFLRAWGEIRGAEILRRDDDGAYRIGGEDEA